MPTKLEEFAAEIGAHVFLKEFSFSKNKFRAACDSEKELADHVLTLPDETFVFQLKERQAEAASDSQSMQTWFDSKVIKKACGQLRDSETFLRDEPELRIENQRGHTFDLARRSKPIVKILLYCSSGSSMPEKATLCRHLISGRAGFVHVLRVEDYYNLCSCLLVPRELSEYFKFRQQTLQFSEDPPPDEAMLTAMFITESRRPLDRDMAQQILEQTAADNASVDLGPILRHYGERVTYCEEYGDGLDYYRILTEFCRLDRADLRSLKKLMTWALESAESGSSELPCRLKSSSDVGVVVIPVPDGLRAKRLAALMNYTTLCKYDWKLARAIGIAISRDGKIIEIDWHLEEGSWAHDPVLENALKDNPFRPTSKPKLVFRYPD